MTVDAAVCAISVALAASLVLKAPNAERRLRALFPTAHVARARTRQSSPALLRGAAVTFAAAAVALVIGGLSGVVVGVLAGVVATRVLNKLEPADSVRRREIIGRELPIALDLLSACLAAGATLHEAVSAVARALGGPVSDEFLSVHAALSLGVAPADAWLSLSDEPLASIGRAFARASTSGAPLADLAAEFAADRRAAQQAESNAGARRAGVAAVAPLGLCFLPAFIGTAVVPVVAGLATHLLG